MITISHIHYVYTTCNLNSAAAYDIWASHPECDVRGKWMNECQGVSTLHLPEVVSVLGFFCWLSLTFCSCYSEMCYKHRLMHYERFEEKRKKKNRLKAEWDSKKREKKLEEGDWMIIIIIMGIIQCFLSNQFILDVAHWSDFACRGLFQSSAIREKQGVREYCRISN